MVWLLSSSFAHVFIGDGTDEPRGNGDKVATEMMGVTVRWIVGSQQAGFEIS